MENLPPFQSVLWDEALIPYRCGLVNIPHGGRSSGLSSIVVTDAPTSQALR